jgi:hypothetical protein
VDGQPLTANSTRLLEALNYLGAPLRQEIVQPLKEAIQSENPGAIQRVLDPHVLFVMSINPELRDPNVRRPDKPTSDRCPDTFRSPRIVLPRTLQSPN